MSVIISGSTGIQNPLGSASAPAESNTSNSNTGAYFPTGTTYAVATAGTNALYIDASQNVGIGTSSPGYKLTVSGGATSLAANQYLRIGAGLFAAGDGSTINYLFAGSSALAFRNSADSAEFARFDTSGNLLVGTTSNYATARLAVASRITLIGPTTGQGGDIFSYDSAGTQLGYLTLGSSDGPASNLDIALVLANSASRRIYVQNRSAGVYLADGGTSWTSNSDERLKTDLVPITDAAIKVSSLRAVTGRFKADDVGTSRAFLIAQDVQKVLPQAVDATDPDKLGVQYADVIPLLVAAINELSAEVAALKTKVGA